MAARKVCNLIDIGANLTDPMFRGIYHGSRKHHDDFENMIKRSRTHGVEKIIITGGSLDESKEALKLAESDPNFFSTVGCHPTRCGEFDKLEDGPESYLAELGNLIKNNRNKVVAIGEIGLDYDRLHFCSKDIQQKYFRWQLRMAAELKLPLFLHNRNSIDDFVQIMEENLDAYQGVGGVVHSFDGNAQDLKRILHLGLHIGINGCSLKTDKNLEVVKLIPSDKLMIETDCPWCEIKQSHASFKFVQTTFQKSKDASNSEVPVKNRNEPSMLIQVLEVIASIKDEPIDKLAEQIYYNTNKLFLSSNV